MKKLTLAAVLLCLIATAARSQSLTQKFERLLTTPKSYVCRRTAGSLKIDGRLDEASWQQAEYTELFRDISGKGFAKPKYATRAKMLWDDDYLYIGAEMEEPNVTGKLTERDAIIYHDNDFEVFIDPDGDCENYFEMEMNALNTVFDLMMGRPYRDGGTFFLQWDYRTMKTAVHIEGTLNDSTDRDKGWSVEIAIPREDVMTGFDNLLKAGNCWRINFSRVEWLKQGGPEENWVWSPTGKIDMHMPDRWAYLYFSGKTVGSRDNEPIAYPHDPGIYRLMWALYYAQQASREQHHRYLAGTKELGLTAEDMKLLPQGADLQLEVTPTTFKITIKDARQGTVYTLNETGHFTQKKPA
ncbi:carbohydrate-binding family 9-like protein [Prevotella sp. kh1p2]|uniref:carbohydrate-binding family 9-like protein n=1 Tax=Prevotella sp. kh1p2 TaxID=1761883 RepID=UPI0008D38B16|nr:carbohydrate-binding family 9-like protein [Prevotella sp. kh1p2]SES80205.1 Carbohydrate family 9 binding domain-like [Prevotella sp. kh1p2]SNU10706.1 Carbohydrate family 9 binding domain-like [Prevotellaceae bacterium KH2P17]